MAWRLQCCRNGDSSITYLLVNNEFTIGRKGTDLLVTKDPSISRIHAKINISHSDTLMKNPEKYPFVTLTDLGSKYGTTVNGKEVQPNQILNSEDMIAFGQCGSNYRLIYEPLVVSTSCVESTDKITLKNAIRTLGGHLVSDWRTDCTHLVMNEVKVTIKAVCALIALKPLVTINYFAELVTNVNGSERPNPASYVPKLGEIALEQENVSFNILPERKKIFKGKMFIFLSNAQYKKLNLAINLSGATSCIVDRSNVDRYLEAILRPHVCVIHPNIAPPAESDLQSVFFKLESILNNHKKRLIPESDIGLAVVHCSTEHYCNPDNSNECQVISPTKLRLHSQSLSLNEVFATDAGHGTQSILSESLILNKSIKVSETPQPIPTAASISPTSIQNAVTQEMVSVISDVPNIELEVSRNKRLREESNDPTESNVKSPRIENPIVDETVQIKQEPKDPNLQMMEDTQPIVSEHFLRDEAQRMEVVDPVPPDEKVESPALFTNTQPRTSTQIPSDYVSRNGATKKTNPEFTFNVEENQYVKCMVVKIVELIKARPRVLQPNLDNTNKKSAKNFKKFKKATNNSMNRLPKLIGGHDLVFAKALHRGTNQHNPFGNEDHCLDGFDKTDTPAVPKRNVEDWI